MSTPEIGTMIEGIGDDVVYSLGGFALAFIPLFITLIYRHSQRQGLQTIHPQSAENVRDTREHLNMGQNTDPPPPQPQGGAEPSAPPAENGAQPTGPQAQNGHQQNPRHRRTGAELTCPICLNDAEYAVETNCGHTFCGLCIVTYWRHGNWTGSVRCPVCRQQVTVLLRNFTETEQRTESDRRAEILRDVNTYNRRYSGQPVPWADYLRDLPTMLRYAVTEFFSVGGLLWIYRLRILLCLFIAVVYLVSPIDIIPEAAFGILGLIDDLFILLLFAIYISIVYRTYLANRDF